MFQYVYFLKEMSKYKIFLLLTLVTATVIQLPLPFVFILQMTLLIKAFFLKKDDLLSVKELLIVLFLGAEHLLIIFPLVYVLYCVFYMSRDNIFLMDKRFLCFLSYSFVLFLFSLTINFNFLNYFLWLLIFLGFISIYFHARTLNLNNHAKLSVVYFFITIIFLQMLMVFYQAIKNTTFQPGDWAMGTMYDAHKLGLIFMFSVAYYLFEVLKKATFEKVCMLFLSLLFLYFCDAKAIILSAFIALSFLFVFMMNTKQMKFIIPSLHFRLFASITFISIYVFLFNTNFGFLDEFVDIYIYGDLSSSKATLYNIVWIDFLDKHLFEWFFGTGPGTFGSKASNMLSGDILYKAESPIDSLIPLSSSYWTQTYMAGLYDYDVFKNIANVSAVLTYPFAGFISIKAELGFFGLIFFSCFYFSISNGLLETNVEGLSSFRKALYFFSIIFYFALLFDNYHEQFVISGVLFLLLGVFSQRSKFISD